MVKKLVLSLAAVACFGAELEFDRDTIAKYEWSLKNDVQKMYFVFNQDGTGKYKNAVDMSKTVGTVLWKIENGSLHIAFKPTPEPLPFSTVPFQNNIPVAEALFTSNILTIKRIAENKKCYEVVENNLKKDELFCIDKFGM